MPGRRRSPGRPLFFARASWSIIGYRAGFHNWRVWRIECRVPHVYPLQPVAGSGASGFASLVGGASAAVGKISRRIEGASGTGTGAVGARMRGRLHLDPCGIGGRGAGSQPPARGPAKGKSGNEGLYLDNYGHWTTPGSRPFWGRSRVLHAPRLQVCPARVPGVLAPSPVDPGRDRILAESAALREAAWGGNRHRERSRL